MLKNFMKTFELDASPVELMGELHIAFNISMSSGGSSIPSVTELG